MTDVRSGRIPLLWNPVGETALAKDFWSNMGDTKYLCVCRRTNLPGKCVYSVRGREIGRGWSHSLFIMQAHILCVDLLNT